MENLLVSHGPFWVHFSPFINFNLRKKLMFIFGLSTLSLVSARSHLVFLSAEVTRDGQVDDYKSDAYDEISERLNGESLQVTTTRQVQLPAEDWKRTLFQEIERSIAELGKQIIDYYVHLKQFPE